MQQKIPGMQSLFWAMVLVGHLIPSSPLTAQDNDVDFGFLNPGIKLAYAFGGGITVGAEVSIGAWNGLFAGAAVGIDYTFGGSDKDGMLRAYLEGEAGFILAGLGFGGSILLDEGEIRLGRQINVFASWPVDWDDADLYRIAMLHYQFTTWGQGKSAKELGMFYKWSYPIGKGNYNTRWDWD